MSTPSLHCAFGTSPLGIDTPEYFLTEDRSQANRLAFDTSNLAFEIEQEIFFDKVKSVLATGQVESGSRDDALLQLLVEHVVSRLSS